ncbi:MAG: CHAT domain-containing protein [bacterium]|nr:CHAT domain-containing protein [bacterium]
MTAPDSNPPASPAILVRRIRAGDSEAEREMVERYSRGVTFLLLELTGRPDRADDLHQETFRLVLEKVRAGELREPDKLPAFIRQLAHNLFIAEYRHQVKRRMVNDDEALAVLREALTLRRESEDRRGEAITLNNLGLAHADLEKWDEALELWTEALALHRTLRNPDREAASLVAMGRATDRLGRPSAIQAMLDPRTTLLEYSLGEERSFVWAVTTDRIESFELPGRQVIEAATREVYEGLRIHDPRARRADATAAARLSGILLDPVADRLTERPLISAPPARRLAIVADGALHYLPFAVLPHPAAPTEPLLVRHEIVSLPSASALGVQRQTLAGRPLAKKTLAVLADPVFGAPDPRLPAAGVPAAGTAAEPVTLAASDPAYRDGRSGEFRLDRLLWSRWEAETIAEHAGGEGQAFLALGFDADLAAVRGGRLRGYRVVHFATHGIVESEHPELSALVLSLYDAEGRSREGFLRLPEIYNLELDAELVVLSGCRTALGPQIRGEGLVGLTRGFFAAGARRLVASLWRVQDHATAELMNRFYRCLLRDGATASPAAALRAAQLELRSEPEFRDPYHWAAFAVYGDWR